MLGAIIRFVISALVLMVVSWLVPDFRIAGFGTALIAALVIAVAGWLLESLLGRGVSPRRRGLVGFFVSAAVIYLTATVVTGMTVGLWGALLAALVIGLIDAFVPTELR